MMDFDQFRRRRQRDRLWAIVVAGAVLLMASRAMAEPLTVTVKSPGPVSARLALPPDGEKSESKVTWLVDDKAVFVSMANGRGIYLWGDGGQHWVEAVCVTDIKETKSVLVPGPSWPDDPKDIKREELTYLVDRQTKSYRAEFEIEGGGPPPLPPLPEPKPGTLGALVPKEARQDCIDFYASWVRAIKSGQCATTGHFRAAHQESMKALQDVLGASGWAAINKPVSDKLASAIGLDDVTLDASKRSALTAALESIASEFKGG